MAVTVNTNFNPGSGSPVAILASDTVTISRSSVNRYSITTCSVYNTSIAAITVSIYISSDTTSASGVLVDSVSVPAGSRVDISSLLGQGYSVSQNVIMVGTATGCNVDSSGHDYIGE